MEEWKKRLRKRRLELFKNQPLLFFFFLLILSPNRNMVICSQIPNPQASNSPSVWECCPISFKSPKNDNDFIALTILISAAERMKLRISRSPQVHNKCVECFRSFRLREKLEVLDNGDNHYLGKGIWYVFSSYSNITNCSDLGEKTPCWSFKFICPSFRKD